MAPSTATVMRLRYVLRLAARGVVLALVVLGVKGVWFAVDQYIAWKSGPRPTLPAGVSWSAESTLVRQLYEPGLWLGLAVVLVVLERRLVGWLAPIPAKQCPGCGYPLEKLEGERCPECGLDAVGSKNGGVGAGGAGQGA